MHLDPRIDIYPWRYDPDSGEAAAADSAEPAAPARAVAALLAELASVIGPLTARYYADAVPQAGLGGGSIGTHVRHCADHVEAVLAARRSGLVDYDSRSRGSRIEVDPQAALSVIHDLAARLLRLTPADMTQPVRVATLLSCAGACFEGSSTLGRELVYVASHTTHHHAIIGVMVRAQGRTVPLWFGFAPATTRFLQEGAGRGA